MKRLSSGKRLITLDVVVLEIPEVGRHMGHVHACEAPGRMIRFEHPERPGAAAGSKFEKFVVFLDRS